MSEEYEKGYQKGYEACVQLYKKRDKELLKYNRVYEQSYFLDRRDFMTNISSTRDRELKDFIDSKTFRYMVKHPRKSIEILYLGDWYLIHESGFIFQLNDIDTDLHIEQRLINHIINHYKAKFYHPDEGKDD